MFMRIVIGPKEGYYYGQMSNVLVVKICDNSLVFCVSNKSAKRKVYYLTRNLLSIFDYCVEMPITVNIFYPKMKLLMLCRYLVYQFQLNYDILRYCIVSIFG